MRKKNEKKGIIFLILLMVIITVLVIGINITNKVANKIDNTSSSYINAAIETTSTSIGTNAVANFNDATGELTISSSTGLVGSINEENLRSFLESCGITNILTITIANQINPPIDCSSLFEGLSEVTTIKNAENLNMANVTSTYKMFRGCSNLTTIDVSNWDTNAMTDMSYTFNKCSNLRNIDVANWKTGNVTKLDFIFEGCSSLTQIDVSRWDVSKVTTLYSSFGNCSSLTTIDVSKWNTENLANMTDVFQGCKNLTEIDVSKWKTGNVSEFSCAFKDCSKLKTIDVSNWDTGNALNLGNIFYNCTSLTEIDVSRWDTGKVVNFESIFFNCTTLTEIDVSNWNTENVTSMYAMFWNCNKVTTLDVSKWKTGKVTNMIILFEHCSSLTSLDVSKWDTGKVTSIYGIFHNCTHLPEIDVSNWNTENVTNMYMAFSNCNMVTELDIGNWDTSKVTNMCQMFEHCINITTLDVSRWNTESAVNMGAMFSECIKLTSINVTNFNTEKVTNMIRMFNNCPLLKKMDIRNFNFSKVEQSDGMLTGCTGLNEIWLPAYTCQNVIELPNSFRDTDIPQEANIYYNEINSNKFSHPRHLFIGVFIFFDLDKAENYVSAEQLPNTVPQYSIVEEESNSGGTEGHGKDILPITETNYSDTITNASIIWNEENVENIGGYKFIGWKSNYDTTLIGVPYKSSNFTEDITYTAMFEALEVNYTVKHWQQNIGGTATDTTNYTLKDTENLRGITDTTVTPSLKSYTGFTAPTSKTATIAGDGSTVVNYYYTRNQYTLTLTKDEGIDSVTGANTYYYGQDVTINAEVNENYVWGKWTGDTTLSEQENTFTMPAENVELRANSIKRTNIEIYYIDKTTNETISTMRIEEGYIGKEYDVKPIQINGYQYSDSSGNTTGLMTEEPIKIYFRYLKETGLNVKYVDINTQEEIAEAKHYDKISSEEYDVTEDYQDIESYTFIKDSGNTKGTMLNEATDVIYYYAYNSSITIKYYDINTKKEIMDSELIKGYEGKEYSLEEKEINGYKFIKIDNPKGKMKRENIQVKYYYAKEVTLTIKYIDTNTREELMERKTYKYISGDSYDLESEIKDIEGYKYVGTNVQLKGEVPSNDIVIDIYYKVDDTIIEVEIPQTGDAIIFIPIIIIIAFTSVIMFIKYKKYDI